MVCIPDIPRVGIFLKSLEGSVKKNKKLENKLHKRNLDTHFFHLNSNGGVNAFKNVQEFLTQKRFN